MSEKKKIYIASAIITDAAGRCLLVRKRGTPFFMQPGGKIEANEPAKTALARELQEELGLTTVPEQCIYVGRFTDVAANEPGQEVVAEIFHLITEQTDFVPTAEIEEAVWYQPEGEQQLKLAPLTQNHLLPLLPALLA